MVLQKKFDQKSEIKQHSSFLSSLQQQFILVAILIVLFFIAGFYLFIFSPIYDEMNQIESNIAIKQIEMQKVEQSLKNDLLIIKKYKQVATEDLDKISKAIPIEEHIYDVAVQINSLASRSGLNLLNINFNKEVIKRKVSKNATEDTFFIGGLAGLLPESFKPVVDTGTAGSNLRRLGVAIRIAGGDYSSLKSFIKSLETNLRITDLNSFSFSPIAEGNEISMKMYYFEK